MKNKLFEKKKSEHADVYSTKYPVIESSKVWFDIFYSEVKVVCLVP